MIYAAANGSFTFRPGPIFANIVLADEINRASPRTQSALLEAMSERQVTTEGDTRPLLRPFLVLATQNPVEYNGTYPLPDAWMIRIESALLEERRTQARDWVEQYQRLRYRDDPDPSAADAWLERVRRGSE